ncbi:membrane protein [Crucian carp herpesvirus]|uniref:Membrane ORF81 n=1 Tax=Cyprinid herpesvirus 2 TaxID=317878 RepID=K7PCQ1_CYHV2|nr:membrane protein ORF81 [Cyprinid herpesvirus 2]APB92928.1 membrane protein [Crucian carp herpesvirus]AFJ20595.1 membrane protein ORF81 [Cyprinid herpesvirus 2]AKC02027.1 hypothetical protein [Cyprinid herpesvirus 2]AMB21650.1 membrane ORF81 [Cyprinid herpesvirus 2]QAU54803.1 membrane protein ORF81 [Cyprinid herpesvirus 2]
MTVTTGALARKAKAVGSALMKSRAKAAAASKMASNKLLVKMPFDVERFKILVATVTQVVCPMFSPLTMGIAHAMYAGDPAFDMNGAFIGIGIVGALIFVVLNVTFGLLCFRVYKGGHRMFQIMRPVLVLFMFNIAILLIGVIYCGIVVLCKTVTYSNTAVCMSNNSMSLSVLELFTASLILLKEALYGGFRIAELKDRISRGSADYMDSDDEDYDSYAGAAETLQRSMRDYADEEDSDMDDSTSLLNSVRKMSSKFKSTVY